MIFRILLLVGIAAFGLHADGISGMLISLVLFGWVCFLGYTIMDAGNSLANFMRPQAPPPQQTVIYKDGLPGHPDIDGTATRRNPDPTGPDEEFAGLITTRIERNRHGS